jgi:acylphosphatase
MQQQTSVFQTVTSLPTLTDSGIEAMAMGKRYAVAAIAKRLKAQEQEKKAMSQKVEDIWGQKYEQ